MYAKLIASIIRLHVKIYDSDNQQFTIPDSVIELPTAPTTSYVYDSDLVFNYDATPFAFWISRRSDPDAMPLFDTRASSLPPTPMPPFNASDPSTAFDGFPLVFEDQYLQVYIRDHQHRIILMVARLLLLCRTAPTFMDWGR